MALGDDIYIGLEGLFFAYGGIHVGSGSILAHRIEIITRNHNYKSPGLRSIPYDERYALERFFVFERGGADFMPLISALG